MARVNGVSIAKAQASVEADTDLQFDQASQISTAAGSLFLMPSTGKVGVNTTSPGAPLDIQDATTSSANTGGHLRLSANDGAAMGDSHRLGVIEFTGAEDTAGTQVTGARIEALTDAAWTNAENGCALYFYTTDANASQSLVLKMDSSKRSSFSGTLGIGTTTAPGAQLDVHDTTTTSANTGGHIRLSSNDGAAMGDSHRLGVIEFTGAEDTSGTQTVGARIEAMTDAAWTNAENGAALYFYTTDGNASQSQVLKLDSNKKATFSGEVQVDYINLNASTLTITDSSDTGDTFSIATTTHGATTIATVDDDATAAHLTLDVDGDITLDADGGDVIFKDGGTEIGRITNSSNNLQIASSVSDGDIKFYGNDGGSGVTALTLDMSDAGAATFNSTAAFRNNHTATGTFSGDIDLSSITKSLNYYVTDAMADGEDIKLPTPTAALAGMVIRIIFTQNTATSISTGIKVGIAHGASAALEGAITLNGPGASSDTLAMVSSSGIHSLQLDSDSLTNAGGAQGSIYEFHYHGSTTLVFVRGWGITTNTGTCALATLTGSPGVTEAVAAAGVS